MAGSTSPAMTGRQRLPATVDHELAAAAMIHPHAGTVAAPAVALGATTLGHLPFQANTALATQIDLAELVAIVLTGALEPDAAIPARAGSPAATTLRTSMTTYLGKHAATAVIDPHAPLVDAPALVADARAFRILLHQSRISPGHSANAEFAVTASALNGPASLRPRRRRRRQREQTKQADCCSQQDSTNYAHDHTSSRVMAFHVGKAVQIPVRPTYPQR